MPLVLTETDVSNLLTMPDCIAAVEAAFERLDDALVQNHPRRRLRVPEGLLHCMKAADLGLGRMGLKVYTSFAPRTRFLMLLYDTSHGDLLAIIEADRLGQMRTGAATGVATKYMARPDAHVLGLIGAGWQAETQAEAVAAVRNLDRALVFSRDAAKRADFADRMSARLSIPFIPAESAEHVARESDIIVTATTSRAPVLDGAWLRPGTHVNAVGSNSLSRAEIEVKTVERSDRVVVDSVEQSKIEAGDLLAPIDARKLRWEQVIELRGVVTGRRPGRESPDEITLFKSNGLALEDDAAASLVYDRALERGIGHDVSFWQ